MLSKEICSAVSKKTAIDLERIKQLDKFLYTNMERIYITIKDAALPSEKGIVMGPLPYLSEEESIKMVQDFLKNLPTSYQESFNNMKENNLDFEKRIGSHLLIDHENEDYIIVIEKKDNLNMAIDLVHEFFHTQNLEIENESTRLMLTEVVSMVAESIFLNHLKKEGISDYDINLARQKRRDTYKNNLYILKEMLPLYVSQKNKHKISKRTFKNLPKYVNRKEENIRVDLLKYIFSSATYLENYKHALGYMLAKQYTMKNNTPYGLDKINTLLKKGNYEEFQNIVMGDYQIKNIHQVVSEEEFNYHPKQLRKNKS